MSTENVKDQSENPEEAQGKEAKKVSAQFDQNMRLLAALFAGNPGALNGKFKVPADDVSSLMEEVFKDEIAASKEAFKAKAKIIIKSKVEFDKFVAKERQIFENTITNKKKEFNGQIAEAFALLASVDRLRQDFANSVKTDESDAKTDANGDPDAVK